MDYAPDYSSNPSSTSSESMNYAPDYSNNLYAKPAKCARDTLKLGVCVNLLKGLLGVTVDTPPHAPCCSLISNLVDLEAAVCLCTTIKTSLLGIDLTLPTDLSLLLNYCGKQLPEGFQSQKPIILMSEAQKPETHVLFLEAVEEADLELMIVESILEIVGRS
ncbi:14 kDa proline-rich protein DC2.15-like [Mercurialis annua]|uniref:14 kDa proline-rich protein DC2.15-like n=1 Tax=Mercurialis annua TaxID=3986 RepID=UPI00215E127C|nr:14 kDa proline-rich protein DC2.15-like [Mercurialis annua]